MEKGLHPFFLKMNEEFPPKKVRMVCKFCGYHWNTLSKMKLVSCPCCLNKIPNPSFDNLSAQNSTADSFLSGGVKPTNSNGGINNQEEKTK